MSEFSLVLELQKLSMNPFPTYEFNSCMDLLSRFKMIIEQFNQEVDFTLEELLKKIDKSACSTKKESNILIANTKTGDLVEDLNLKTKINRVLTQLLRFLVMKLSQCENDEAFQICSDFFRLKECIVTFRESSKLNNSDLDEIIYYFVKKLIQVLKSITTEQYSTKMQIFNVLKVMVTEFGKYSKFTSGILLQIFDELRNFDKSKKSTQDFEFYFTFLYITNGIICCKILNKIGTSCLTLLNEICNLLKEQLQNTDRQEVVYLIKNILRAFEIFFHNKVEV